MMSTFRNQSAVVNLWKLPLSTVSLITLATVKFNSGAFYYSESVYLFTIRDSSAKNIILRQFYVRM